MSAGPTVMITLVMLLAGVGMSPAASAAICGRSGYPDVARFDPSSVMNASLWETLTGAGGFAGGAEGQGSVSATVEAPNWEYQIALTEVEVTEFVGGSSASSTHLKLLVLQFLQGPIEMHSFRPISFGGRAGGNLTLAAWEDQGSLELFWRWAYLPCDETFPNAYYVFHARISDGQVADDNRLVYFEAPRPRRAPPTDLILLVVAGSAASVIFLYARRALKREKPPKNAGSESEERTVK